MPIPAITGEMRLEPLRSRCKYSLLGTACPLGPWKRFSSVSAQGESMQPLGVPLLADRLQPAHGQQLPSKHQCCSIVAELGKS